MNSKNQSGGKKLLLRMLKTVVPVIITIALNQNSEGAKYEHIRTACMDYMTADSVTGSFIGNHYDYANGGYSDRLRGIRAALKPTIVLQYTASSSFYCEQGYHDCDSIAVWCARTGYDEDSMYLYAADIVDLIDYDVASSPCVVGHVNHHNPGDRIRICEFNTWRAIPNYKYSGVWAYLKKYYGDYLNTHDGVIEDYAAEWSRPAYPYRWGYTSYPWQTITWSDTSQVRHVVGWTTGGLNGRQIADSLIQIKRNHWLPGILDTMQAVVGAHNYFINGSAYADLGCDVFEDCIKKGSSILIGEYVWISNGINWPGVWPASMAWSMMDSVEKVHNGAKMQVWNVIFPQDSLTLGSWSRAQMERLAWYYMAADTEHTIFLLGNSTTSAYAPNAYYAADTSLLWFNALSRNIGQPTGQRTSQIIGGATVYYRPYGNAVVYWRQAVGGPGGNYGNSSAVTFDLGGTYHELYADNTLGPQTTTGQIRNCEGKIYISTLIDSIPPAAIHDLGAAPGEQGQIVLTWTAPGDDGYEGTVDRYIVKYSQNMITESNWSSAITAPNLPAPLPSGQTQNMNFGGLNNGEIYYFAIKAIDEVGNTSDLSNVDTAFAGGIDIPTPLSTIIDTSQSLVTLLSSTINSYLPIYYEFALDTLVTFPSPQIQIDVLADRSATATFDSLLSQINYYWHCRAKSNDPPDSSEWSLAVNFVLSEQNISGTISCIYPGRGATVNSSFPVLTAQCVAGVEKVYFQVDDNYQFTSPIESGAILIMSENSADWQVSESLENFKRYYWRASSDDITWTTPLDFAIGLDIHAFPNPYKTSNDNTVITFTNLPRNSDIIIATISGTIVRQVHDVGPGDWVWDIKNNNGEYVASGVYLNSINFPSGSTHGKLMIIR